MWPPRVVSALPPLAQTPMEHAYLVFLPHRRAGTHQASQKRPANGAPRSNKHAPARLFCPSPCSIVPLDLTNTSSKTKSLGISSRWHETNMWPGCREIRRKNTLFGVRSSRTVSQPLGAMGPAPQKERVTLKGIPQETRRPSVEGHSKSQANPQGRNW